MEIQHPTWMDPRIEIRASPLHGRGAFARRDIETGEVVTIWAHSVFSAVDVTEIEDGEVHERPDGSCVWLPDAGVDLDGYDIAEEYLNHSWDPNVWMTDEVTLVARRRIAMDDELTGDYALWLLDPDWVCPFECRCGTSSCRGRITGRDWERPELQERYVGHWHPVIERRIRSTSR